MRCWHKPLRRPVGGQRALARPDGGDRARARSYTGRSVTAAPEKLLLAAPRGYCAGVDRAVQTVERALELHGAPVYVRKEIVHNKHVVEQLADARRDLRRRARRRDPRGRGDRLLGPRRLAGGARRRRARAACGRSTRPARWSPRSTARRSSSPPTATRSSSSAMRATRRSRARWARSPGSIVLVRDRGRRRRARGRGSRAGRLPDPDDALGRRDARDHRPAAGAFPAITGPRTDDICYATTNRQLAVKQMAEQCDLVLVIGSRNSSNSNRLVDVARDCGAGVAPDRQRVRGARGVARGRARRRHLLRRERARGAGAARLVGFFRARGTEDVSEFEVLREDVRFMLPKVIRQQAAKLAAR